MSEPTRYLEIELNGPGEQAVGYVEGYRLGSGESSPVWFAGREDVDIPGFWDRIRQRLRMETRVIAPEPLGRALITALERSELLEIEVGEVWEIDYAELAFDFEVYDREDAKAVVHVLKDDLPDGVRIEGYEVTEKVDESAKGPELYTPLHDYVLSGRGRYVGPVPGIIAMAERLSDQSFIHPEKIQLHRVG